MTLETDRFSPTVRQVAQSINQGASPEKLLADLQQLARSGRVPLHDVRATEQEVRDDPELSPAQKQFILEGLEAMRGIIAAGVQNGDQADSMEWLSNVDPFARAKKDLGIP